MAQQAPLSITNIYSLPMDWVLNHISELHPYGPIGVAHDYLGKQLLLAGFLFSWWPGRLAGLAASGRHR